MKSYKDWQLQAKTDNINEATKLSNWISTIELPLDEATSASRYSVEVNYRSQKQEVLEAFAKIVLGYVSAALKQNGFHIKHVYDEKPVRILISSRNWDDGEWVGIVYFHPEHEGGCFVMARGFYNRDIKSVSLMKKTKCKGDSAAEITAELRNLMHELKKTPDRHSEKLKGIPLKRGPKG